MAESLPVVPIVACRSDKCAHQAERVSSPVKHLSCREGVRRKVDGLRDVSRSERQYKARKRKKSTIEASMLLKIQDGIGKRTQNESKNEPGFECQMRGSNPKSALSHEARVLAGRSCGGRGGFGNGLRSETQSTAKKHKNNTTEANMLLKIQGACRKTKLKRTRNEASLSVKRADQAPKAGFPDPRLARGKICDWGQKSQPPLAPP